MNAVTQLKLPRSYHVTTRVAGRGDSYGIELVILSSSTAGHVTVYAMRASWLTWLEITKEQFYMLACNIIENSKTP